MSTQKQGGEDLQSVLSLGRRVFYCSTFLLILVLSYYGLFFVFRGPRTANPQLIAHRGGPVYNPENTMKAFQYAETVKQTRAKNAIPKFQTAALPITSASCAKNAFRKINAAMESWTKEKNATLRLKTAALPNISVLHAMNANQSQNAAMENRIQERNVIRALL